MEARNEGDRMNSTPRELPKTPRPLAERIVRRVTYGQIGKMLARELRDCDSVVDVGCGTDSRLQYAEFEGYKIGADAYPPALAPDYPIHHEYVDCDIRNLAMPDKSVDACACLDVIEHLTKANGIALLDRLERIARKRVIVATPNGFVPQPPTADNPFQEHVSGWDASEMRARGYRVYGLSGYRRWRGMYGNIVGRPWLLYFILSKATEWYFIPRADRAFALFCVKDVG
jgi:SAM-dependent methyltransferase